MTKPIWEWQVTDKMVTAAQVPIWAIVYTPYIMLAFLIGDVEQAFNYFERVIKR